MNIYLLERIGSCGYDENRSVVVRAASETAARCLAKKYLRGDEDMNIWSDKNKVSCQLVPKSGSAEIILTDFNAG